MDLTMLTSGPSETILNKRCSDNVSLSFLLLPDPFLFPNCDCQVFSASCGSV